MIPYGRQTISDDDIAAVSAALRNSLITQGPVVEAFERQFAAHVGAKHAVAVNNATSALQLAMRVAGIGPGDRVVTSPITFLASANAAVYLGAVPDFADIDAATYTLDPAALAREWKPDTRAVVAVDYAGQACDLPEIARVARSRGAVVIGDACHAVGGSFHSAAAPGRSWRLGGNPWADMTVFSFHPVKTMTTGEGGMLVTDRQDWADHARLLRTHGMVRERDHFVLPADDPVLGEKGPWYYEMQDLGWNFRMTEFQAALGISQLGKLEGFLARRREIVAAYNAGLADLEWIHVPRLRHPEDVGTASWHLYTVQVDFAAIGQTRSEVFKALAAEGVLAHVLYIPVHLQPWYRKVYGYGPGKCPVAENFYAHAMSLPLFPTLEDSEVRHVIESVRRLGRSAARTVGVAA